MTIIRVGLVSFLLCLFVATAASADQKLNIHFFTADNCPACAAVHPVIEAIADEYPQAELIEYQIWRNRPNMKILLSLVESHNEPLGSPALFIGNRYWIGFSEAHRDEIASTIRNCLEVKCVDPLIRLANPDKVAPPVMVGTAETITVPVLGQLDAKEVSLPLLTLSLGLLDSINPCAFFVLLFLLGLLVHAHSHTKMLIIGGVFVFFSGLIYFLFMAAWFNFFLLAGGVQIVTFAAGLVAITVAIFNIKDFFQFKQGGSLSMSEAHRGNLSKRIRSLVYASKFPGMIFGTIILAIAANSYELLCTVGFPMVFTRVLTLHELPVSTYYFYLAAYNVVYVLPLLAIVIIFSVTLGSYKLSEWQGRELKLASGVMMLVLGFVLILKPTLLNSLWGAISILGIALLLIVLIVIAYRSRHSEEVHPHAPPRRPKS